MITQPSLIECPYSGEVIPVIRAAGKPVVANGTQLLSDCYLFEVAHERQGQPAGWLIHSNGNLQRGTPRSAAMGVVASPGNTPRAKPLDWSH